MGLLILDQCALFLVTINSNLGLRTNINAICSVDLFGNGLYFAFNRVIHIIQKSINKSQYDFLALSIKIRLKRLSFS